MNTEVYKRKIYEQIYSNLTAIQRSYGNIAQQISRNIGSSIPSSPQDVDQLDHAESQIQVANDCIRQLEEIKYICSLSFLTDGSFAALGEISKAIEVLDKFTEAAELEANLQDSRVVQWAVTKKDYYTQTRVVLLDILDHKIKRKIQLEKESLN